MQAIRLRAAQEADQDFLFGLYAASRADELRLTGCDPQALDALLRLQFFAQRQHYLRQYPGAEHALIEGAAGPIGRWYVQRGAGEIRLVDICLLPDWRGQGIGAMLLRRLLAEGARAGLPVRLSATAGNPAQRLYRRLGFRVTGGDGLYDTLEWSATTPQSLEEYHDGTT